MKRKRPTKKQLVEMWKAAEGRCWRCEQKIEGKPTPKYETDWVAGHCEKPHWLGGVELAVEHVVCNVEDAKEQTRLAAKSVRMQAKAIGIPKSKGRSFNRPYDKPKKTGMIKQFYVGEDGRERVRFLKPAERE